MFFYIYQNVLQIFLFLDICLFFYIFLKLKHIKKEHFEVNFVLSKSKINDYTGSRIFNPKADVIVYLPLIFLFVCLLPVL